MKYSSLFILFALWFAGANAQSLQVTADPSTSNNTTNQFTVGDEQITLNNESLSFGGGAASSDIANSGISATVGESGISIYEVDGTELINKEYDMISDDSSLKIYAMSNGGVIVRENIANFLIYNPFGDLLHSISNSSQSSEGESISELAADPYFRTIVLYNPKIVRSGQEGSRVSIVDKDGEATDIFNSVDRAIRKVNVSENGQFISIITYNPGTDDEAVLTDRFGNELNRISFDQTLTDTQFSDDGRFITLRSNSRIAAHSVMSGERVGGTSFRSTLHFAEYIPEDNVVLALTADKSGDVLTNVELHAVNLEARSIERQSYNSSLGTSELIPVALQRNGRYNYSISGFSQNLNVRASF